MKTIIIILLTSQSIYSKNLWERTYGSYFADIATEIISIDDNNILIAGHSNFPNLETSTDNFDMYILKVDSSGNIIWDVTYGGKGDEKIHSMAIMKDSSIVLTGQSKEMGFESQGAWAMWLVKISSKGHVLWHKSMGGKYPVEGNKVIVTENNEIMVAGYCSTTSNEITQNYGKTDYWVIKLDSSGKVLWEKNYGGTKSERANSIIQTDDDCFIVIGGSSSTDCDITENVYGEDLWIIKIDTNGNLIWDKSYGKEMVERGKSIAKGDGYFIISAQVQPRYRDPKRFRLDEDIWLIKIDDDGDIIWDKEFGGSKNDLSNQILIDKYENILIAGARQSLDNKGAYDFLFMKVNKNGELLHSETYGGNMNDVAYSISTNTLGEVYLAGYNQTLIGQKTVIIGGADYWIIKFSL